MAKGNKSIRFFDESLEIVNNYPTSYRGCYEFTTKLEEIIKASNELYIVTKLELKNYFSTAEACLIVDVNNSYLYTPQGYSKSSLRLRVVDGDKYEGLGEKWEVNIDELIEKIDKLTNYQCHCIFLMCNEFWNMSEEDRGTKSINEIVAKIFKSR